MRLPAPTEQSREPGVRSTHGFPSCPKRPSEGTEALSDAKPNNVTSGRKQVSGARFPPGDTAVPITSQPLSKYLRSPAEGKLGAGRSHL